MTQSLGHFHEFVVWHGCCLRGCRRQLLDKLLEVALHLEQLLLVDRWLPERLRLKFECGQVGERVPLNEALINWR